MKKSSYKVKSITESLKDDFKIGLLTIEQVAEELYLANHTNHIDIDYAKKMMI